MRRVVVVGYGMAGARFADEVLRRDPTVALTVLGEERHPAYNRVLLSSVVAGSMTPDSVRLHGEDWAASHGVDLRLGVTVTGIDRARRVVLVDGGEEVPYDALVLATGARSWIPPTEGLQEPDGSLAPGVVSFRSLEDCERIIAAARPGTPVAVLGGGLLGLEAARGLAGRGCLVTVVHPVGHLMERQLDAGAGRVLARSLGELGIEFRLGSLAGKDLAGDGRALDDGSQRARHRRLRPARRHGLRPGAARVGAGGGARRPADRRRTGRPVPRHVRGDQAEGPRHRPGGTG